MLENENRLLKEQIKNLQAQLKQQETDTQNYENKCEECRNDHTETQEGSTY